MAPDADASIDRGATSEQAVVTVWNRGSGATKLHYELSKFSSGREFLTHVARDIKAFPKPATAASEAKLVAAQHTLFANLLAAVTRAPLHVKRRGVIFDVHAGRRDPLAIVIEVRRQPDAERPAVPVSISMFTLDPMGDVRTGGRFLCLCSNKRQMLDAMLAVAGGASRSYLRDAQHATTAATEPEAETVAALYRKLLAWVEAKSGSKTSIPVTHNGIKAVVAVTVAGTVLQLKVSALCASRPGPVTRAAALFLDAFGDLGIQFERRRYVDFIEAVGKTPRTPSEILQLAIQYFVKECGALYPTKATKS
jgi:hypothetical protein